jgi:predicted metal-dependent peptidase
MLSTNFGNVKEERHVTQKDTQYILMPYLKQIIYSKYVNKSHIAL